MNIHLGQTGAAAVNLLMQSPVVVPGELLKQMSLYRLSSLTMNKKDRTARARARLLFELCNGT